jgi:hypothetical protein
MTRKGIHPKCGYCCRSFCDYVNFENGFDFDGEVVIEVESIEQLKIAKVGYRIDLPEVVFYKLKKGEEYNE